VSKPRILGFVMAGGKGERLVPLTQERSKPSVPFGARYRIVDFVLSNFVNSRIFALYVLVQYKSQSLIEHLRRGWQMGGPLSDHFITVVPPQMRLSEDWYRGTADAVAQNLHLIEDFAPDLVAIFGADHVYRMDLAQMVDFHCERRAAVTVAALPVPIERASGFGIVAVDTASRIVDWQEKPKNPPPMPNNPCMALSSMGNYLFDTKVLLDCLIEDACRSTDHDFGRTILPELIGCAKVYAYDFLTNRVPGLQSYEEVGYWRDVGTIEAYWQAHMDLLGAEPRFNVDNPLWPILTSRHHSAASRISGGLIEDCLVGEGGDLRGATVRRSILGRGVRVGAGSRIEESVVMDGTEIGEGCRLTRTIVDRYNALPDGTIVGEDADRDTDRFSRDASGIVVIPRGGRTPLFGGDNG
jgi:glucose-1-phosphate adenylyltransferase